MWRRLLNVALASAMGNATLRRCESEFRGSAGVFLHDSTVLPRTVHIVNSEKPTIRQLRQLLQKACDNQVRELDLLACDLPDEAGFEIGWALQKPTCALQKLLVPLDDMNSLQWMFLLMGVNKNTVLEELVLRSTARRLLGLDEITALTKIFQTSSLKRLHLPNHQLNDPAFAGALRTVYKESSTPPLVTGLLSTNGVPAELSSK
jgi:hypothetical protein